MPGVPGREPAAFEQAFPGRLLAGPGARARAAELCAGFGQRVLIVAGASSLERAGFLEELSAALKSRGLQARTERLSGEPTVQDADRTAAAAWDFRADCLLAVGGGSVLDLAKAAAALTPFSGRAEEYLEGLGTKAHPGTCLPWIAMPTTAGTGSECTSNAVLKGRGKDGAPYKKSLRHPNFLPRAAILDPDLQRGCPPTVSLPCAFDALSQLLEAASSRRATPITDAIVFQGLALAGPAVEKLLRGEADSQDRLNLSLAAAFSGLGLSGAGLGLVHGIAGALGAATDLPHGAVCAALAYPCFRESLSWLELESANDGEETAAAARAGLRRFARISLALGCGDAPDGFVGLLEGWTKAASFAPFASAMARGLDVQAIAASASCRDSCARPGREATERILKEVLGRS